MAINGIGGGGVSPVAGPSAPRFTSRSWLVFGLLVFAAALVFAVVIWMNGGPKPELHEDRGYGPSLAFERPPVARPMVANHPLPLPLPQQQREQQPPAEASALDSPMLSYRGNGYGGGNGGVGRLATNGQDREEADDELAQRLRGSKVGGMAQAHVMKHPETTIPAGTVIPCTLQTAINSQLVGFVDCILPEEVRGATGTVVLLDRGTQIFGEVRSGLRQGQDRLFLLWVRARTPQNVIVELDSPAADELGRAGVPGAVDNHFWQRFGAALLFSVVDYAPQLATQALQGNNGSGNINNYTQFLSPNQQLANTILSDSINIPPTLEKNQGDSVSIFVARDLDFSSVYDLQTQPP